MKTYLYAENKEITERGYVGTCPFEIEKYAKENNLYFSMDDMRNCYLSENEECEAFEEICELD